MRLCLYDEVSACDDPANDSIPMNKTVPKTTRWTAILGLFLLALSTGCVPESTNAEAPLPSDAKVGDKISQNPNLAIATLAGGCFWCTEAVFERMIGVSEVTSGYIGGSMQDPDYKSVCSGRTGHAEAVQIIYDPSVVKFEDLLKVFFKTHDPTTLNRQGGDYGTQYRSAIFPQDEAQREVATQYIAQLNASGDFKDQIVTSVEPLSTWYPAEEYHQDYFRLNPNAGYCRAVVANKVRKFNREFGSEYLDKTK